MAIARFPCSRFIATDVNPLSASAASTLLTQSYPATDTTVLVGASAVPLTPQVLRSVPADIRVLHELFGSFASSEGAPLALSEVRSALMAAGKTPTFAPQVAATFVTPVFLTALDVHGSYSHPIRISSDKLIMVKNLDLPRVAVSDASRHFERYDFGSHDLPLVQTRTLPFRVTQHSYVNALACFIHVGFPSPPDVSRHEDTTCTQP
jgi:hypothetical protein